MFVRILPVVYLMLCGSVEYVCGLSMSRSSKPNLHKKINASNDQIGKPTFFSDRRGMLLGVGSSLIFWGVSSPPSLATGEDTGEGFRSGGYGKGKQSFVKLKKLIKIFTRFKLLFGSKRNIVMHLRQAETQIYLQR